MKAHRPTIMGTRHMISATQYLAAEAGFKILEAGGNAIDAGVAAGIALGVVQPEFVNFAGVAPIIIYSAAENRVVTIPGLGTWPKALDRELLQEEPRRQNPARHHAHRGAGGARCLDHRARALRHHELRRGGAVGDRLRARRLSGLPADVRGHHRARGRVPAVPVERRALSAEGPPAAGRRGVRAEGARAPRCNTWRTRRRRRARADARPASPRRATPSIAATSRARSSSTRRRTAASSRPRISRTIARASTSRSRPSFGDITLYACGPWCQGPSLLQALNLLDAAELHKLGHNSRRLPAPHHRGGEARLRRSRGLFRRSARRSTCRSRRCCRATMRSKRREHDPPGQGLAGNAAGRRSAQARRRARAQRRAARAGARLLGAGARHVARLLSSTSTATCSRRRRATAPTTRR